MSVYKKPYYYDLAFSYRNINEEVDFFEQCITTFSNIQVLKLLDVGCGPCPYASELVNRGYEAMSQCVDQWRALISSRTRPDDAPRA